MRLVRPHSLRQHVEQSLTGVADVDVEGLDPVDQIAREREQLREDERDPARVLQGRLAVPHRDDGVVLLDQPIQSQGRASDGGVVLDLVVECVLALQRAVAADRPHDVVRQSSQDPGVIGPAEAVDVVLDHGFSAAVGMAELGDGLPWVNG